MSALFHAQFGVSSRGRGQSVIRLVAYQMAARVRGPGHDYDFRRKRAEHVSTVMLAPEGAPDWTRTPSKLWARVEAAETRINSQEARMVEFAIPRQVPQHFRAAFVRAVAGPFVAAGMIGQADLHLTVAADGAEQPHAHLLLTLRELDPTTETGFARAKARHWNEMFADFGSRKKTAIRSARQMIADQMNTFCAAHGIDCRVDPRTLAEQGIDREPEPGLPRWMVQAAKSGKANSEVSALHTFRRAQAAAQHAAGEIAALEAALTKLSSPRQETQPMSSNTPRARKGTLRGIRRVSDNRSSERRRQTFLAALLRDTYDTDWLPPSVADNIDRINIDKEAGFVTILLKDGGRIRDEGDHIWFDGLITETAAQEMAEAAARRGWEAVELTGSTEFKNAVTLAMLLRQPPIPVTNHTLPPDLQAKVDAEIAARTAGRWDAEFARDSSGTAVRWLYDKQERLEAQMAQRQEDPRRLLAAAMEKETDADQRTLLAQATKALADHRQNKPNGLLARANGALSAWKGEEAKLSEALQQAEDALDLRRRVIDRTRRGAERQAKADGDSNRRRNAEDAKMVKALDTVIAAIRNGDTTAVKAVSSRDLAQVAKAAEHILARQATERAAAAPTVEEQRRFAYR